MRMIPRAMLAVTVAAGALALAPPAQAVIGDPLPAADGSIFNQDQWTSGTTSFNQATYCNYGTCDSTYYAFAGVDTPKATPTAGETFYVHAWTSLIWPGITNDVAGMTLGLPQGVSVATSAATPMKCFIARSRVPQFPSRETGECPVSPSPASGAQIPIGAFTLFASGSTNGGGEIVHVFVPVVSNRQISGEDVFVSSTLADPNPLPRDLVGNAPLTVAPGTAPVVPGGKTTLSKPSGKSFTWRGKRKVIVSWTPVDGASSYKARLKVGRKWTKWKKVSTNGLRLTKLKRGKRYVLAVRAVGAGGKGPVAKWQFRAK